MVLRKAFNLQKYITVSKSHRFVKEIAAYLELYFDTKLSTTEVPEIL
jgi:hypothetical protein